MSRYHPPHHGRRRRRDLRRRPRGTGPRRTHRGARHEQGAWQDAVPDPDPVVQRLPREPRAPVGLERQHPDRPDKSTDTTVVGGVEYLATHLKQARVGHPNTVTVAAGDMVGASPLLSAAFHDEPTVEALNTLGLDITAVGNHEFDEGYKELQRLQNGGCIDDGDGANNQNSCADHTFTGAKFQYLAANVLEKATGKTILPPYAVKNVQRCQGRLHRHDPQGHAVDRHRLRGRRPRVHRRGQDRQRPRPRAQGAGRQRDRRAHPPGRQRRRPSTPYDFTCKGGGTLSADSPIIPIAEGLDPAIDMIISGHTHQPYVCSLPDPNGQPRLVTSASSFGRLYQRDDVTYDRRTSDIVRPTTADSRNMLVTRDRRQGRRPRRRSSPSTRTLVTSIASKVLGQISADVTSARPTPPASRRSATSSPTPSSPTRRSSPVARPPSSPS